MNLITESTDNFLAHCEFEKGLTDNTLRSYRTDIEQFLLFVNQNGIISISNIDKFLLKEYIQKLNVKYRPRSIMRKIASLKAMFNYWEFDDLIDINPFRKIRLKIRHPKSIPKVMSRSEVYEILKNAYDRKKNSQKEKGSNYNRALRDLTLIELLFSTGIRVSELCSLKASNINLEDNFIKVVGKGGKERIINLSCSETVDLIKEYTQYNMNNIEASGNLFLNRLGAQLSSQSVRGIVKKAAAAAKLDKHITPHSFRHTFATLLLENEVDLKYIQHLLGHSSIMTTQIYTHVNLEKQKEILSKKHPRHFLELA